MHPRQSVTLEALIELFSTTFGPRPESRCPERVNSSGHDTWLSGFARLCCQHPRLLGGIDPLQVAQTLRQRRAVIASAQPRLQRMRMGIEASQGLDPQQGSKQQGLQAPQQRPLLMMQQGTVVIWMGVLLRLDRLLESGHHRHQAILLVEPMGTEMPPDTRPLGRDLDHRIARAQRAAQGRVARAAFFPRQFPLRSEPVKMADAHYDQDLTLGDLCEHLTAWALPVLMEQLPPKGQLNSTKLSPSLKRWTYTLREGTLLAQDERHDFILLEICFRMKSALSLL